MSLSNTPQSERTQIAFFGKRNAGKSSLVNAITKQEMSVVSRIPGTTTDPVTKSMEILPLGPVVIIDTPGLDDAGDLGALRVQKTEEILQRCDIAVIVYNVLEGMDRLEEELMENLKALDIPYLVVANQVDRMGPGEIISIPEGVDSAVFLSTSATNGTGVDDLKEALGHMVPESEGKSPLIHDLTEANDIVVLVTPIDESAPKGRMILPQQMVMRDLLDHNAMPLVTQVSTYQTALASLNEDPKLVVTDSQAFKQVAAMTPKNIPLTSFSILMARYKGILPIAVKGAEAIDRLPQGAHILIAEGCTHHRQCGDIGTVKLPKLLKKYTGKEFTCDFTSGKSFPSMQELESEPYDLIIHCGGCMLTDKDNLRRYQKAEKAGISITNYGIAIAKMQGILERSISML